MFYKDIASNTIYSKYYYMKNDSLEERAIYTGSESFISSTKIIQIVLMANHVSYSIYNSATLDSFEVNPGETRRVKLRATSDELYTNEDSSFYTISSPEDNTTYFSGTKLFYFGSRYYDPELGVFVSTDPQDQYWNAYSYCGGDPVNLIDPDGESGIGWLIAGIVMLYVGFSIKNQVNDMDPSDAWNPFQKEWWTGEPGKEGTGALTAIPNTEIGVDSDKGPYYDVGGQRSYPVYDSKRKRSDQQSMDDFNNKARNITENVNSSNQEFYPKIGIDQFALNNEFTPSPPYAIWSSINVWSVNQYVKTDNPIFYATGLFSEVMKSIVPKDINDWGYMTGGIKMIGGYPMPANFHTPRTGIKATILRDAGNYQGKVGKNPDIDIRNGKIILKGTGKNKGKYYQTDLNPSWYFND